MLSVVRLALRILFAREWFTDFYFNSSSKTGTPALLRATNNIYKLVLSELSFLFWVFALSSEINLFIIPLFFSICFINCLRVY